MTHFMNGHPFWSRPARTKDYDFVTQKSDDEKTAFLFEAPALVRAAIKAGLIVPPKEEVKPLLGPNSEWARCKTCATTFSRQKGYTRNECATCRLPDTVCNNCGKTFRPLKRKQLCCSMECRIHILRNAAKKRSNEN
jgi:hypothetical protein